MSTTTPRVRLAIAALALPHAAALQDFLPDSAAAGEDGIDGSFGRPERTHAETVAVFERWSREEPRPGWVPCTTRLLFDGERIVGGSNLRYRLTPHLLSHGGYVGYSVRPSDRRQRHAQGLLRAAARAARRMEIDRLLVTCDASNTPSTCGGVLVNEVPTDDGEPIRRYWIRLRPRRPTGARERGGRIGPRDRRS